MRCLLWWDGSFATPKCSLLGFTIVVSRRNGLSACHMIRLNSGISTRLSQAGAPPPGWKRIPSTATVTPAPTPKMMAFTTAAATVRPSPVTSPREAGNAPSTANAGNSITASRTMKKQPSINSADSSRNGNDRKVPIAERDAYPTRVSERSPVRFSYASGSVSLIFSATSVHSCFFASMIFLPASGSFWTTAASRHVRAWDLKRSEPYFSAVALSGLPRVPATHAR